MYKFIKMENWLEDELADREFISFLVDDLNGKQLGYLLSSIEIMNGENLHKGVMRSKLLLDKSRRKLVYKKIKLLFYISNNLKTEEISTGALIEFLKEKSCNDRQIALTLFLQNHYYDALIFYYDNLDNKLKIDKPVKSSKDQLHLEINRVKKENINLLQKKKEVENDLIKQHLEYEKIVGDLKVELKEANRKLSEQKSIIEKMRITDSSDSGEKGFVFKFDDEPIKAIAENFPSNAIDVAESLEMMKDTLDQTIIVINNKITHFMTERIFMNTTSLFQLAETVHH